MVRRLILFVGLAIVAATGPPMAAATAIDGRVAYLQTRPDKAADFAGSLRFGAPPGAVQLRELAALGVRFGAHHGRTVYPARIPFSRLADIAARGDVVAVECAWRPGATPPPLHERGARSESDLAREVASPRGGTLTGRGVTVAHFDTGVRLEHMALFHRSGQRFVWLDRDGSGDPTPGDAVDLDGDGHDGPGEDLACDETLGVWGLGNEFGVHDAEWDLLFNDRDADGVRDFGPPDHDEHDPCLGERLFLADDLDGDGRLTPDEPLIGLGPSKVRAVRDHDGTVYRRGVDLLAAPGDHWPHGTYVAGIVGGGWPRGHGLVGTAPGVEFLEVVVRYADEPPFVSGFTEHLAWAVDEGADIVLIEDGEWVWEFLDGSSNFEIMLNEYAADGLIVVVPAGNLADGHMHARFRSSDVQTLTVAEGATASWPTFLWTDPVALTLEVTPPLGGSLALPLDGSVVMEAGYAVYGNHSVSPRGTHRIDVGLRTAWEGGGIAGEWRFRFGGADCEVHGYFHDDASGWTSASRWSVGEDATHTVVWPATADSAIVVAAANVFEPPGEVFRFSGLGPRLDGVPLVDLAAPGYVGFTADPWLWNGYDEFGGTSCAAPFVAGAAALLKELDPTLDHGRCRRYLRAGALGHDGDPRAMGAGELRVMGAVSRLLDDLAATPPPGALTVTPYPNPFNAGATIRYRQLARGTARIRVFDAAGREVWRRDLPAGPAGWREVAWNGDDAAGRALASGVYLVHVRSQGQAAASKVTLLR